MSSTPASPPSFLFGLEDAPSKQYDAIKCFLRSMVPTIHSESSHPYEQNRALLTDIPQEFVTGYSRIYGLFANHPNITQVDLVELVRTSKDHNAIFLQLLRNTSPLMTLETLNLLSTYEQSADTILELIKKQANYNALSDQLKKQLLTFPLNQAHVVEILQWRVVDFEVLNRIIQLNFKTINDVIDLFMQQNRLTVDFKKYVTKCYDVEPYYSLFLSSEQSELSQKELFKEMMNKQSVHNLVSPDFKEVVLSRRLEDHEIEFLLTWCPLDFDMLEYMEQQNSAVNAKEAIELKKLSINSITAQQLANIVSQTTSAQVLLEVVSRREFDALISPDILSAIASHAHVAPEALFLITRHLLLNASVLRTLLDKPNASYELLFDMMTYQSMTKENILEAVDKSIVEIQRLNDVDEKIEQLNRLSALIKEPLQRERGFFGYFGRFGNTKSYQNAIGSIKQAIKNVLREDNALVMSREQVVKANEILSIRRSRLGFFEASSLNDPSLVSHKSHHNLDS